MVTPDLFIMCLSKKIEKFVFWKHIFTYFIIRRIRKSYFSYLNGQYINTFQTNLRNVVIVVFLCPCLCLHQLMCRGLQYLLKARSIILVDLNGTGFLSPFFLGRTTTLPYMSKKISQKRAAIAFGGTYFHQTFIECMSNQYTHFDIKTCQMGLQVTVPLHRFTIKVYQKSF